MSPFGAAVKGLIGSAFTNSMCSASETLATYIAWGAKPRTCPPEVYCRKPAPLFEDAAGEPEDAARGAAYARMLGAEVAMAAAGIVRPSTRTASRTAGPITRRGWSDFENGLSSMYTPSSVQD